MASLRRAARVSGEWKRPDRRAKAEAGRKEESFERERALVRGRTMIGIWVLRDSSMRLSTTVGALYIVSTNLRCHKVTYLMVIEIQEQYAMA